MRHVTIILLAALAGGCAASETCPPDTWDCGGTCQDLQNDSGNCGACGVECEDGQICRAGACELSCPEGMTECSGVCRDLATDDGNCGICDMGCSSGFICVDGTCTPDCPEGYTDCSGVCRDLEHDPSNCGECGTACAAGETCLAGTCTFACPAPYTDCSGTCADLSSDHLNCGACGAACAEGEVCAAGTCETSCLAGLSLCSGECVDLMRDPLNCGSCGSACGTEEVCDDGTCSLVCSSGLTDCSGSCRDLDSDRFNCGTCGNVCGVAEVCDAGACTFMCLSPLTDCSGVCTSLDDDPENCGTCGNVCNETHATAYCSSGACGLICHTNYADCDVDVSTGCEASLLSDPSNCGACGTVCGTGEMCLSGRCEVVTSRNVLVYYDSFTSPPEPAGAAATALGWTVTATNNATTFATSYDAGGWHIIVIDVPGSSIPTDVRTRVLSAISAGLRVIFSWWNLDTDAALATALGVSTVSYSSPLPLYPTSGASVDFFTSGEVFPAPLTSSDDAGDNGDFLTLLAGGEIVISGSSGTGSNLAAITNSGNTIVLGFLPWDFKSTDNDADGRYDMTEMFMNLLRY